jgi:hypothetical protein
MNMSRAREVGNLEDMIKILSIDIIGGNGDYKRARNIYERELIPSYV